MKLQRHKSNPIISPRPVHHWENLVTTNPAAWYDPIHDEVRLLYRACGSDAEHRVTLALATSRDGVNFQRYDRPVFEPSADGWDSGTVQDARVIQKGEWYYIVYAARAFTSGQYWDTTRGDELRYPYPIALGGPTPPDDGLMPINARNRQFLTGVAVTRDFRRYLRCGYMTDPRLHDHDVIPFPERIGGKLYTLRRPMQWKGEGYPCDHASIWISEGDDLLRLFDNHRMVATARYDWEVGQIGANTVPMRTDHGWLVLHHAKGPDNLYRLGAMLLDLDDPGVVLHRTPEPIMEPEEDYEFTEIYHGCLFPCGKILRDGVLHVYYGAGDKHVGLATVEFDPFMNYLRSCPA